MSRVTFLVDGLNVYHSLREAAAALGGRSTKWLDLRSIFTSYMNNLGKEARLEEIWYFTSYAFHRGTRDPDVVNRHRAYVEALVGTRVQPVVGRFKQRQTRCAHCGKVWLRWEEKETDVAISAKMFEILHQDRADTLVLVSGDTDLCPALRTAKALFPAKQFWCLFPFNRKNEDLVRIADGHFRMRKENYVRHQLPDPATGPGGRSIAKPRGW
jgi:uncharacterized LabA/DUF88 family protein